MAAERDLIREPSSMADLQKPEARKNGWGVEGQGRRRNQEVDDILRSEWQAYDPSTGHARLDPEIESMLRRVIHESLEMAETARVVTSHPDGEGSQMPVKSEVVLVDVGRPKSALEPDSQLRASPSSSSTRRASTASSTSGPLGTDSTRPQRERALVCTMGPNGFVNFVGPGSVNERYKIPHFESPYGRRIKKFMRDRRGESECASCFDNMKNKKLVSLDCQHRYCGGCFEQLISAAMNDEQLFPPRCCLQRIPEKLVKSSLNSALKSRYKIKAMEYAIPAADRWYCPYADCARWMDVGKHASSSSSISCPHCKRLVCDYCRGPAHALTPDCPLDLNLEAALRVSELNGWRRCVSCRTMVELSAGCRHITCKCGAQFCYVCGVRWGGCTCTQLDQDRRRAQLAARQQGQAEQARPAAEARRLGQARPPIQARGTVRGLTMVERRQQQEERRQEFLRELEQHRTRQREIEVAERVQRQRRASKPTAQMANPGQRPEAPHRPSRTEPVINAPASPPQRPSRTEPVTKALPSPPSHPTSSQGLFKPVSTQATERELLAFENEIREAAADLESLELLLATVNKVEHVSSPSGNDAHPSTTSPRDTQTSNTEDHGMPNAHLYHNGDIRRYLIPRSFAGAVSV